MEEHHHSQNNEESSLESQLEIPFDSTTNFSLLGYFLDKLRGKNGVKKRVDLNLDEQ